MGKGTDFKPSIENDGLWYEHRSWSPEAAISCIRGLHPTEKATTARELVTSVARRDILSKPKKPPVGFVQRSQTCFNLRNDFSWHDNRHVIQSFGEYFDNNGHIRKLGRHQVRTLCNKGCDLSGIEDIGEKEKTSFEPTVASGLHDVPQRVDIQHRTRPDYLKHYAPETINYSYVTVTSKDYVPPNEQSAPVVQKTLENTLPKLSQYRRFPKQYKLPSFLQTHGDISNYEQATTESTHRSTSPNIARRHQITDSFWKDTVDEYPLITANSSLIINPRNKLRRDSLQRSAPPLITTEHMSISQHRNPTTRWPGKSWRYSYRPPQRIYPVLPTRHAHDVTCPY